MSQLNWGYYESFTSINRPLTINLKNHRCLREGMSVIELKYNFPISEFI